MKKKIRETISEIINEYVNNELKLYHGTCKENGDNLIKNGWKPMNASHGGNMGNPDYLYLSSEPQDALWFAEENGCDTVIEISNVPIDHLRPDPEDEAGFTMEELLTRIETTEWPSKFILTKPLGNQHFKLYKIEE